MAGIVLLLGLVGGVALAAVAGARRTATAYDRMLAHASPYDVLVNPDEGTRSALTPDDIAGLPGVKAVGTVLGVPVMPVDADGQPSFDGFVLALADGAGREVARPIMSQGRVPQTSDEVLVGPAFAEEHGVGVGQTVPMLVVDYEAVLAAEEAGELGALPGEIRDFTVSGIGTLYDDVSIDEGFQQHVLLLSEEYVLEHGDTAVFWGAMVQLHGGHAAVEDFKQAVQRLVPDEGVEFKTQAAADTQMRRGIRPHVVALSLFAGVLALALLVVVGQALTRELSSGNVDNPTLRGLGMTAWQLAAAGGVRAGLVVAAGAAVAVVVAVALSPIFPLGLARLVDPALGLEVDLLALGAGAAALVILLLSAVAPSVLRAARGRSTDQGRRPPSRLVTALTATSARPSVVTGLRMAFEAGQGRTGVPVRSAVAGTAVAVGAVVAAFTFGAGLHRLVSTPALYGWPWDAIVYLYAENEEGAFARGVNTEVMRRFRNAPEVDRLSVGINDRISVGDRTMPAVGLSALRGEPLVTVAEGGVPTRNDEIALGSRSMARLGVAIGDTVAVTDRTGEVHDLRVVGQAVLPGLGTYHGADRTELGTGALLTRGALVQLGAGFEFPFLVADYEPGIGAEEATATLTEGIIDPAVGMLETAVAPQRPADVIHLERVQATPLYLAGVLAVLGGGALVHALVMSVRRRRRDLAVLKTLGFVGSQLSASIAWQATAMVVTAVLVAVPLGVAAGRWAWILLAGELGVPARPATPALAIAGIAAAAVVLANAVAAIPGYRARSTPAATILRTE